MAHRPGGGLGHHGGQAGGAAFGNDDAVSPRALGGADHRPQVVGVAQLVAHHDQGGLPLGPGGLQDVVHAGVLPHRRQGDHPLVGVGAAHAVQLAPVALHHHNALGAGGGGDVSQGRVGLPPGQIDLVDRGARPQGLRHGVAALDDAVGLPAGGRSALLHGLSCLSHWSDTGQQYTTRRRIKKAKIAAFLQKERWASPLVFHRKFTGFAAPFLVFSNSLCYNYNYFEY